VQINYGYSWFDFSNVPAQNVTTGLPTTFNYLQAENIQLGTDMTTSQLEALILLHEFKHTPAGGNAPQVKRGPPTTRSTRPSTTTVLRRWAPRRLRPALRQGRERTEGGIETAAIVQ